MKNTTLIATTLSGVVALAVGTAIVVTATAPNATPNAGPPTAPSVTDTVTPDETVDSQQTNPTDAGTESNPGSDTTRADASKAGSTADIATLLTYLFEEEKLAHDVYVALGDKWGSTIFTNISASESQHQSLVESLLLAYDIDDPRIAQAGIFVNEELQSLYDLLIAQGMTSARDAMEVGVLIEQTDIRDLQHAIDETDDPAVDAVLERLLNASNKHLAAFTRQL